MLHNIAKYIVKRLDELKWQDKLLAEKTNISKGQISKLKNEPPDKLSAQTFYSIVKGFDDDIKMATKIVYPNLKIKTIVYNPEKRNKFGNFMLQFESNKNLIEEIAYKTGIEENRLKELYYRKGSLEAYELILIENAIGKRSGELFEKFYDQ